MNPQQCIAIIAVLSVLIVICLYIYTDDSCIFCKANLNERVRHFESMREAFNRREFEQRVGGRMSLTAKEQKVNQLIMSLKYQEFKKQKTFTLNASNYEMNVQTDLFSLFQDMPKGGVLHVRDIDICDVDCLMALTYNRHLWICMSESKELVPRSFLAMRFSVLMPSVRMFKGRFCNWTLLKSLRENYGEELINEILRARLAMTSGIEDSLLHGLITFKPIWETSQMNGFENLYLEGVQYIEMKSSLPVLYDLSHGNWTTLDTANILYTVASKFSTFDGFFGARLIYAPIGIVTADSFDEYIHHTLFLKQNLGNYLTGMDLGNLEFKDFGLNAYASRILAANRHMYFYFHAPAHKCWNLIDAILLLVRRISCPTELMLHPQLERIAIKRNLPVELSPASNQVSKITNAHLFANGMNVVLVHPDSLATSSNPLTKQFYYTFMEIAPKTAHLSTIKQVIWNSLEQSSLSLDEKINVLNIWWRQWNSWINGICEEHKLHVDSIFEDLLEAITSI